MRYCIILFILVSVLLWWLNQVHANTWTLAPPSLKTVLKDNEKRMKLLEKKKKTSKASTWIIQASLSYKTLVTGKSITLSSYDTVDLWVQEIRLSEWARIESLLTLGGYDEASGEPLFQKKKVSEVVSWFSNTPFSIINGQFFDPRKELTPLSFGVKMDGVVRTAGADNRDEPKNILIVEDKVARIVPYSWEALRDAPGYFAMVNLTLDKSHHRDELIGRTYICLKTPTADNTSNTLLIFTALSMSETTLEWELPRWWCTRSGTTKLDASGSTRLWVAGEYIFGKAHKWDPDYRKIPHYIAVWDRK